MCLAVMAVDLDRRFPLVVASNRDEFFDRPAAPLDWWQRAADEAPILSGRDLVSGGTWLGLSERGRLALLTNVRGVGPVDAAAPSRGAIVPAWLATGEPADRFWMRCALAGHNGFNLFAADFSSGDCFWVSNRGTDAKRLSEGVYGLSNASLDTPWPKVQALKARVRTALATTDSPDSPESPESPKSADALAQHLFAALADRSLAPDAMLPQTGVALDWERRLSAAFIASPEHRYGTRCSTLVITERSAGGPVTHLWERSFDAAGSVLATRHSRLRAWPPAKGRAGINFQMRDAPVTTC